MNSLISITIASACFLGLAGSSMVSGNVDPTPMPVDVVSTIPHAGQTHAIRESPHDAHLRMGEDALEDGELKLGVRHFHVAHAAESDSMKAATSIVRATAAYVNQLIDQGEHVQASHVIEDAATSLLQLRSVLESPDACPQPLKEVLELEDQLKQIYRLVEVDASEMMVEFLNAAEQSANDARRWYWFNRRDEVLSGLRTLRPVLDRLDVVDRDTQAEFIRVVNLLKSRVSDKEWDSLWASAGFE